MFEPQIFDSNKTGAFYNSFIKKLNSQMRVGASRDKQSIAVTDDLVHANMLNK
jgi:hypothetical protein